MQSDGQDGEAFARSVSQYLLEKTGSAYFENNFDAFANCFLLPQQLVTFDVNRTLETVDDIRDIFDKMKRHLGGLHVTELIRTCIEAQLVDETTITATHETRMLSGTQLVSSPSIGFSVLKRQGTEWKIAATQYAGGEELNEILEARAASNTKPSS